MLYKTHVQINLDHVRRNLEQVRAFLGPGPRLLFAVKADGYGHGAVAVASLAERAGLADWLGLATVPEGIELRRHGIKLPILKFSPAFPDEMADALDAGITLPVCEPSNLLALQAAAAARRARARVHLKVDTGMGRTGIAPEEAPGLARTLARQCPDLYLEGVFTHLAVGFEADGEAFTREQLGRFTRTVEQIASVLGRMPELVHCASSGAILAHPECWLSMVRTGTLGYGYYPLDCPVRPIPLAPALSFHTRVAYVKRVAAGASIGYGRTWTAPRDTWIATLPVGYADGFSRLLSNRGRVLVAGRSCPVVGLVCMDQTMVDLGPETRVRAGDEVVLIGRSGDQEITLYELAKAMGTVPCDVACQIGRRVERITIPQVFTGRGLTGARPAS